MKTLRPKYGRMLEDFEPGAVYAHPWDVTIDGGTVALFQASFMDAMPTFASRVYAEALGFRDRPIHSLLLLNLGLSFSVQDVSEQAIAHLAYIDVRFPNPCYPGDTVTAASRVIGVKPASSGDRGVVHVRTTVCNQVGEVVCTFERKALVRAGGKLVGRPTPPKLEVPNELLDAPRLPSQLSVSRVLPSRPAGFAGFYDDVDVGDVILHQVGKTVGESEHMQLTSLVRNSHPLHFDEHYCKEGNSFTGTRVVYGGLVFSWVASLSSRDVAGNALWDLGFEEGAHPSGVVAGDTLYAASKVLAKKDIGAQLGEITYRLVGVKNARPDSLVGGDVDLFAPELGKTKEQRVPEKVFEITRTLLVRKSA
ncbi:MAG: MaoC family dehydratase [Sandaracinaceae bacterium]|nr:MaoC family dehydratase [Sandaracinaceae bacterium]